MNRVVEGARDRRRVSAIRKRISAEAIKGSQNHVDSMSDCTAELGASSKNAIDMQRVVISGKAREGDTLVEA